MNFDLSALSPKGKRIGIDLKGFSFHGNDFERKRFPQKVAEIDSEIYRDAYVYVYCSVDAIVPIWAYFLITSKLTGVAKKIVYGTKKI